VSADFATSKREQSGPARAGLDRRSRLVPESEDSPSATSNNSSVEQASSPLSASKRVTRPPVPKSASHARASPPLFASAKNMKQGNLAWSMPHVPYLLLGSPCMSPACHLTAARRATPPSGHDT
jgi:hypothetical protein